MNHDLKIVATADGSNTIYNALVGENYHSKHGALQESRHVFVNQGLLFFLDGTDHSTPPSVSILEVGFGTGLNFLLSVEACAERSIGLNYTGIEAYPLTPELISQTGYDSYLQPATWKKFIEKYPDSLGNEIALNDHSRLQVAISKLLDFQSDRQFDIIYFDAFAAVHQPEMWDEAAIGHTVKFLKPGGVFVTYAITGNLKRTLKSLGCTVQKAPGAPGKREMLRAVKAD